MSEKRNGQTIVAQKTINEKVFGKSSDSTTLRFKNGLLKKHLIIEAGSKFSNNLKLIDGADPNEIFKNIPKIINDLKYKMVEFGKFAILINRKRKDQLYLGKVISFENYGTDTLYYLKVEVKQFSIGEDSYTVEEEYMLDPREPEQNSFIVKTRIWSLSDKQYISIDKINKILGRRFYKTYEKIETSYIPAVVILNPFDGEADIEGLEEIFNLERQLLKEIERDLNLSRKKVLYKTRLARKTKGQLEVEMNNDSIVVFEDGNAVFTSPIDLWAPALTVESITRVIDWLVNYTLKMKFASKDTMSTGAQKTNEQVSEINQSAQNYLEDKKELYGYYLSRFFSMISGEEVKVELQLMTTINRLVNGGNNINNEGAE